MKNLAVFDFDHTILEDNSDTAVFKLTQNGKIPQDVKKIMREEGWTAFMQAVFTLLHKQGVSPQSIKKCIKKLTPVSGMIDLIEKLHKNDYDQIIISDSNTLFIQHWLESHGIDKCFLNVFTNPAEFIDDLLKIKPFHFQDDCKLSTSNLCKGRILDEFLESQKIKNVVYGKIVYIGDGANDFCPVLRLKAKDLACARNHYKLVGLIEKAKNDKSETSQVVHSDVFFWDTGHDIISRLELKH